MSDPLDPTPATAPAPDPVLLLVDDEPSVLSALRRLFRMHGYRILQATGGEDGLAILKDEAVDLVISDMRMPGMDGARFLQAVREHDPSIVRILLTGYADIGSTIAAINGGEIHRYIAKPWVDQDMLLMVREALGRRRLEQQNVQLTALSVRQNEELRSLNQGLESRVKARTAEIEQINDMLEKSYEELNSNFMLAVTVFSGLLEMREDGMAGHSRRVADLAKRTAQQLNMAERQVQDVYLGGLLHDIGKIGFPDKMLGKPVSTFAPDETSRYRRHPVDGESALMPLAQLHGVAKLVRQHHERFDGKGFPDGLQGQDIALGARIIAAASDYDGLLHGTQAERHYTPEMARQAMRGGADTRYDPKVVAALEAAIESMASDVVPDLEMEARELLPGMVLAHDLLSSRGAILLAAGYVFDARVIRQVSDFAQREGVRLTLRIQRDSIKSMPPTGAPVTPAVGSPAP